LKKLGDIERNTLRPAEPRPETTRTKAVRLKMDLAAREAPPPDIESSAPFFLKAHPERWTVIGGQVVPAFGKLKLQPGLNGVGEDERTKRILWKAAQGQAEERDWTIIPWEAVPPEHLEEGEEPSYLVQVEGRADCYLLRYERVYPGSKVRGTDEKGYLEFCAHLLEKGVLKPPQLYVLERMLEKAEQDLQSAEERASRTGKGARVVKRLQQDVEAIQAAIGDRKAPARTRAARPQLGDVETEDTGATAAARQVKPRARKSAGGEPGREEG